MARYLSGQEAAPFQGQVRVVSARRLRGVLGAGLLLKASVLLERDSHA